MQKQIISAAQRLAQLKVIPSQKLPSTLKTQIKLANIFQIRLHYRAMCKNVGPSLRFVRQYGPALRWYNPNLLIQKKKDEQGPMAMQMLIFSKNMKQPVTVIPNQYKKTEDLLKRIQQIDSLQ